MTKPDAENFRKEAEDILWRAVGSNATYERIAVKLQQFGVDTPAILDVIQNLEQRSVNRSRTAV